MIILYWIAEYKVIRYNELKRKIGNISHKTLSLTLKELQKDKIIIRTEYPQIPTLIRPTGGAYNDAVIASMKELGLPIILWNIDSLDWKYHDDADVIRQRIIDNARDGAIVLEHDLYETTVEGVLAAIDELQEQGYAFVTVSELAEIKGVTLEPGKVYTGFTQDDVVIDHGSNFS